MFEQLFQAYEQKLPRKALRELRRKQWVNPAKYAYDCPGERLLEVEYRTTPTPQFSFRWIQEWVPVYGFLAFSFLFLVVSLGIGIFRCASASAAISVTWVLPILAHFDMYSSLQRRHV